MTRAHARARGPITRPDIPRLIAVEPGDDAVEAPPDEPSPPEAPQPPSDEIESKLTICPSTAPAARPSMVRLRNQDSGLPCAVLDIVTADGSRDPRREP